VLSSTAVKGSNLAAVTFSAPGYVQVVYMDAQANTLYTIENFPGTGYRVPLPLSQNPTNEPSNPNNLPSPLLRLHPRLPLPLLHQNPLSPLPIHRLQRLAIQLPGHHLLAPDLQDDGRVDEHAGEQRCVGKRDGAGPGGLVVSTRWSDQVRIFHLEDGGGGEGWCRVRLIVRVGFGGCCPFVRVHQFGFLTVPYCHLRFLSIVCSKLERKGQAN